MTINFSIDVPNNKLSETLLQLSQVFGTQSVTPKVSNPVTTVDPPEEYTRNPKTVEPEKAVISSNPGAAKLETADKPSYSITTIRAKAKDVAGKKGTAFLRECLDAVNATSISMIEESKFADFMNLLSA